MQTPAPVTIEIPQGLGDAVYCYPILKHLLQTRFKNNPVCIWRNPYRLIFEPLAEDFNLIPSPAQNALTLRLHYVQRRAANTTQYEDLAISAGLPQPPEFSFDWPRTFTDEFRDQVYGPHLAGRQFAVIKEPCRAHMHKNRPGKPSVEPDPIEFQRYIDYLRAYDFLIVSVGQNEIFSHRFNGVDLDLNDKIKNVQDLLTLVQKSSAVLSQIGHLIPIAQAFKKRFRIFYPRQQNRDYRPEKFETLFSLNYPVPGAAK